MLSTVKRYLYGSSFKAGDKILVRLDMQSKTLSFSLNGQDQGVAFKDLAVHGQYRLAVALNVKQQTIQLTKTVIWDKK